MISMSPPHQTPGPKTPLVPPPSHRTQCGSSPRSVAPTSHARAALLYCLVLVLLPLVAIPAGIALGRSDFFLHHGASLWVRSNDAVFDIHDRTCDVLVFGDSTAMTGIDPAQVQRHTGLRTCNVAVTNAVLAVTGNLTLDHFLAHNPKPGVLLVQLSPDDFQATNRVWHQTIYAEGMLELLRHGSPAEARHLLFAHPVEATAFAGYATGYTAFYVLKRVWFHTTHILPSEDAVQILAGSTFFTPPAPARSSCQPAPFTPPSPGQTYSRSLVEGYRQGYSARAALILVNVAPIPACDQYLAAYSAELHDITSNRLLPLPINLFNDDRHFTAIGAEVVSQLVSEELNTAISNGLSTADRHPATLLASLRRTHSPVRHALHPPVLAPSSPGASSTSILGLLVYPHEFLNPNDPQPAVYASLRQIDPYAVPALPLPGPPSPGLLR